MIFNITNYIKSREVSSDFLVIFRLLLGGLALLQTVLFFYWNYPFYVYNETYVSIPIFHIFNWVPSSVHSMIYILMLVSSIGIIFNKYLRTSLFYSEFHNYFAFHQDIFLGAIIFLFSTFIYNNKNTPFIKSYAMFAIQITIIILYISAGVNKLNDDFLTGFVITPILETSLLYGKIFTVIHDESIKLLIGQAASYFAFFIEILFPILIIFKRTRSTAVALGILLHLGIETTGRGMLFNLYIPAMYMLWYTAIKFPKIVINKKGIHLYNIKNKIIFILTMPMLIFYFFHLILLIAVFLKHLLEGRL